MALKYFTYSNRTDLGVLWEFCHFLGEDSYSYEFLYSLIESALNSEGKGGQGKNKGINIYQENFNPRGYEYNAKTYNRMYENNRATSLAYIMTSTPENVREQTPGTVMSDNISLSVSEVGVDFIESELTVNSVLDYFFAQRTSIIRQYGVDIFFLLITSYESNTESVNILKGIFEQSPKIRELVFDLTESSKYLYTLGISLPDYIRDYIKRKSPATFESIPAQSTVSFEVKSYSAGNTESTSEETADSAEEPLTEPSSVPEVDPFSGSLPDPLPEGDSDSPF